MNDSVIHVGDVLDVLPTLEDESVHCCVTSPPYWFLRDYGVDGQLGLEPTPEAYVANMVRVFAEVRRVLRDNGTLWLNLGDSYAGGGRTGGRSYQEERRNWNDIPKRSPESALISSAVMGAVHGSVEVSDASPQVAQAGAPLKPKDLVGIPWRVAFALQADGWYLRSDIIWSKPNPMPESVTDRPTKAHEYVFLLSKAARYWYDADAIKDGDGGRPSGNGFVREHRLTYGDRGCDEPWTPGRGRSRRTVWTIATQPYPEAHFATYPEKLVEPCILAGCPEGGTVLDPFTGSGTTGAVACRLGRNFVGIELNPEYAEMAERRIAPHRDQMQMGVAE